MPAYDYTCARCGHLTEVIHGIHAPGLRVCPNCGAEGTMRKGFAAPAVHFKGSGWAKKDRSTASSAMTKAKAAGDGGASGSGDGGGSSDASARDSSETKSASSESSGAEKKAAPAGSGTSAAAKAGSSGRDD